MSDDTQKNDDPESEQKTLPLKAKSKYWWLSQFLYLGLLFLIGISLIVTLGFAQRIGWIKGSVTSSNPLAADSTKRGDSENIHTCPMHPQIRQPGEGRCPICGMELVPATSTGGNLDEFAVSIEPAQRRLANIQTAKATLETVSTSIKTIGAIQIDESRQSTIAAYIDGRVERLFADYTGVEVEKDDHLAVVYSPQLYGAQVEYIQSKKTLSKMSGVALAAVRDAQSKMVGNSRQKLIELGMTTEQIEELETTGKAKSRLTIYSPIGGTVIEKLAEEGKYITAGEPIYRIANLSTVWLMLELYPEDASRIRFGQSVKAELSSLPGTILKGRVAFISPTVDKDNRTVGVRVEFNNEDGKLRPGDYAQATIDIPVGPKGVVYDKGLAGKWISPMHPQIIRDKAGDCPICGMKLVPTSRYGYSDNPVPQPASLVIPRSALLMAGKHSVVYVETEEGRFELRTVTLGSILAEKAIILDGLKSDELVATSGNFLIDSQMQLAGKPSLIDPSRYIAKKKEEFRNTPLNFESIQVAQIDGELGQKIESLYSSYFKIQNALTKDQLPKESDVMTLSKLSEELGNAESLNEKIRNEMSKLNKNSAHLHHLKLKEARVKFKTISHAVVTLSTQVRGENAKKPFNHFFCPMVKKGEGDWLQNDDLLSNPYYGSQMLRCGELVRKIPVETKNEVIPKSEQNLHEKHKDSKTDNKGEK